MELVNSIRRLFGRVPSAPAAKDAQSEKPRAGMRISDEAVGLAGHGDPVNPFELPKAAPGVLPKDHKGMAMDAGISDAYAFAGQLADIFQEGLQFLGYQYLAALTQRAEYRRPAEILAKHMTRKWVKLQATGEDDKTDKIKKIEAEWKRLNVQAMFRKAVELDGFFGRAQIYIDTGADLDDRDEIKTPLTLTNTKIGIGSLKRLKIVEPIWTYPNRYNSTNPLGEDFYIPQSWFVMGAEVHASRLLTIIGRPLPDLLKPAYAFGGLSLSQMAKPYVDNWMRTRQSVADLLHSFSVMVLKTNMSDALNNGAGQDLRKRIELFLRHRDNRGLMVLDQDTEDLTNVSTPLGSLDALQAQSQEQQSSVTGIPLSILLGITPHGLNASNEGEIRSFYDWLEASQESTLSPGLKYILDITQLSLFGEIDPGITFMWEPLWTMSDKERGEIRKQEADVDAIYIQEGVISPQESRARLAQQEDSPYASLDLDAVIVPPDTEGEGDPLAGLPGGDE